LIIIVAVVDVVDVAVVVHVVLVVHYVDFVVVDVAVVVRAVVVFIVVHYFDVVVVVVAQIGYLKDLTGTYFMSFVFASGCSCFGGLIFFICYSCDAFYARRERANLNQVLPIG